jgi:hypothetical protein
MVAGRDSKCRDTETVPDTKQINRVWRYNMDSSGSGYGPVVSVLNAFLFHERRELYG